MADKCLCIFNTFTSKYFHFAHAKARITLGECIICIKLNRPSSILESKVKLVSFSFFPFFAFCFSFMVFRYLFFSFRYLISFFVFHFWFFTFRIRFSLFIFHFLFFIF